MPAVARRAEAATPQPPEKIAFRGLAKSFRDRRAETVALAGIDLSIHDGEFVCIVGPSGCGKTTALRILAGLEQATGGEVVVHGATAPGQPQNAMVFQEQSLFPWMTVRDKLLAAARAT